MSPWMFGTPFLNFASIPLLGPFDSFWAYGRIESERWYTENDQLNNIANGFDC